MSVPGGAKSSARCSAMGDAREPSPAALPCGATKSGSGTADQTTTLATVSGTAVEPAKPMRVFAPSAGLSVPLNTSAMSRADHLPPSTLRRIGIPLDHLVDGASFVNRCCTPSTISMKHHTPLTL